MIIKKASYILVYIFAALLSSCTRPLISEKFPNIIFIGVDDLANIESLEKYSKLHIPNIERLQKKSISFTNARTAASLCNPSRTAILTGKGPYSTGVYDNENPSQVTIDMQNITTIIDSFKNKGYTTINSGKIHHYGMELLDRWDKHYDSRELDRYEYWDWGVFEKDESEMDDSKVVQWTKNQLATIKQPFFIAIGLRKPHTAWVVPKKYFDIYPLNDIKIPDTENKLANTPQIAKAIMADGVESYNILKTNNKLKEAIQAYLASVSFMDAKLGEIVTAVENSPSAKNTIIIFWSDHGYHLGSKSTLKKKTLWDEVLKIPLMIYIPGVTHGETCSAQVNLLDLYPTLIELCHLDKTSKLDGHSLVPLIKNPQRTWSYPSISTNGYRNYAVTLDNWKYIQYVNGAEELYNLKNDPNEKNNLANRPEFDQIIKKLSKHLPKEHKLQLNKLAPFEMKWISAGKFWIDEHEVTNYEFNEWAKSVKYKTEAELLKAPCPGSLVFRPNKTITNLEDYRQWWKFVPGAEWKHPQGAESNIQKTPYNPVVQVSYNDAQRYCQAQRKRLPTEDEWELAAGDIKIYENGKWLVNIFQGEFPQNDSNEDGYAGIAPIKKFPTNKYGLYDMGGNVWEWVTGTKSKTLIKGGSYLCGEHCRGFDPNISLEMEAGSATDHIGFRCIRSELDKDI